MKILLIGDVHAQVGNLDDLGRVFDLCSEAIKEHKLDRAVLLGDLFHSHSVVRLEVIDFFKKNAHKLNSINGEKPIAMVGNHDLVGPTNDNLNAVSLILGNEFDVISKPFYSEAYDAVFTPFIPDESKFIESVNNLPEATLFCHQTFDGSVYENGFYAPEGIDQNKIKHKLVISGHIHKEQTIGKVVYVGTPRATTASDANESKGVFLFDTVTKSFQKIITDDIVKCFKYLKIEESNNDSIISKAWKDGDDVRVEVCGSEEFYRKVLDDNAALLGSVKFIPNIKKELKKSINIDNSESVKDALYKYVTEVANIKEELREDVWKRINQKIAKSVYSNII